MKKTAIKRVISACAIGAALLSSFGTNAQIKQYYIGTASKSEVSVAVKALPDGSSVIAGFTTGGSTGTDMLLLRVKNGVILWQKTWGTANDDLIQDMIITQNGDIVVVGTVGRTAPALGNTAAIFRFTQAGSLVGQNYVRDTNPGDAGGDVFYGVCELGNGNIVAVGNRDNRGDYGDGLISTFDPTVNVLFYNDVFMADKDNTTTDNFEGAVSDPNNPNNIFITGYKYDNGKGVHDGRISYYTPPVGPGIPGTMNWDNAYSFYYSTLGNDIFTKIKPVNNTQFLIDGWMSHDCCGGTNQDQLICRIDATAATADIKVFLNNKTYANSFSYFPLSYEETYITETPSDTASSPSYSGGVTILNGRVSHITNLTSGTVDFTRQFQLPGNHSVVDLVDASSKLYMTGAVSGDSDVFGGVDIYYVESGLTVKPADKNPCQVINDSLGIYTTAAQAANIIDSQYSFTQNQPVTVTFTDPGMDIKLICGDETPDSTCSFTPTKLIVNTTGVDSNGNCIFTAIAYGHTTSTIVGYEWTIGGQPTFVHHSNLGMDTIVFTLPPGASNTVSVVVDAVNFNYAVGTSPCCQSDIVTDSVTCNRQGKKQASVYSDNAANGVSVYPNPTQGSVNIHSSTVGIKTVDLIDMYGKTLGTYEYGNVMDATISVKAYTPGTYIVRVNKTISKMVSKMD